MRILVTGATGYIGGRLVPRLLEEGHSVRVMVRDAGRIAGRTWAEKVEVAVGDVFDVASLERATKDIDAAFYLIHSMGGAKTFRELDRQAAQNFAAAARRVPRTIYLGGLLPPGDHTSEHLGSRAEVGEILRSSLPALELRAGPIIGAGSASFEMVRYLTERLPAMIAPRWIDNRVQPVGIDDVLSYLVASIDSGATGIVEIGSDRLTFRDMMQRYAEIRGLKRLILPVPVLAPRIAGLWVGLVTPIPNSIAVPLIEGIVHPVIADTTRAEELFPTVRPLGYGESVRRALEQAVAGETETRWSGALRNVPAFELSDREGLIREVRAIEVAATPQEVFDTFTTLGGEQGWLVWNSAWRARGLLDRIVGGPGLRRGRRHAKELLAGEAVDFWRVEKVEPPNLLRLRAEMKVPGRAWLQWEVAPADGGAKLVQTAIFAPQGLFGALYWYALYPLHKKIFSDLARAIRIRAEGGAR
jgi:uncharacterized protein YbjT (DUF2867 family)/uncharacterized protein YndB with AHSA1/START domain